MPRSDPTRSRYCAARHLLRHLSDPRALRKNPLVARLFVAGIGREHALARAQAAVAQALAEMDASASSDRQHRGYRYTAILLRVDALRERPDTVAADLNLAPRHFQRERRRAFDRFLAALDAGAQRPRPASVKSSLASMQLEQAARLTDSGQSPSAIAICDDVARSAADPSDRCSALLRLADIAISFRRFDRARAGLDDAATVLENADAGDGPLERMRRTLALRLALVCHGPSAAREFADLPHERVDDEARMKSLYLRGEAAMRGGDFAAARTHIAEANALASRLEIIEAALRVDLLIISAALEQMVALDLRHADALMQCAVERAVRDGFAGKAIGARLARATYEWVTKRDRKSAAACRAIVGSLDPCLTPEVRYELLFSAADVEEAAGGDPRMVIAIAKRALKLAPNVYEDLRLKSLIGRALVRSRTLPAAQIAVGEVVQVSRSRGYRRLLAAAETNAAEIAMLRGERNEARELISDAIEQMSGHASMRALVRASRLHAEITGKPSARRALRELAAAH